MRGEKKRLIIAIDGPAGAGKSTTAREVARRLGYLYIDTGAMYRAVALKALREGTSMQDETALTRIATAAELRLEPDRGGVRVFLDGEEVSDAIRSPEVSALSSVVSAVPGVRAQMVKRQREMGRDGGVVMEGRDIGTVVFPDADIKLFLDASACERARRRHHDLETQGVHESEERVLEAIHARDARDSGRAASPLRRAADATLIETDDQSVEQVVARILELCAAAGQPT
jgi:cytidylate kinase